MRFVSCNHWYSGRYICTYVFVSPSVGNNWEWFAEVWIFKRAGWRTQQWVCESLTLHCWHVGFCWLVCGSICTCSVPACTVLSLAQHMDCYHPTCMHVRHTFSVCDWNYVCNYVFTYVQYDVCTYLVEVLQCSPSVVDAEFVCIPCITCCPLAKKTLIQMFW